MVVCAEVSIRQQQPVRFGVLLKISVGIVAMTANMVEYRRVCR